MAPAIEEMPATVRPAVLSSQRGAAPAGLILVFSLQQVSYSETLGGGKQVQDLMHVQHGRKKDGLVSSPSMGRPGPRAGPGRGQAGQHHPDLQVDQVISKDLGEESHFRRHRLS